MSEHRQGETQRRLQAETVEAVFARICLQRGWLTREDIVASLKEKAATPDATLADRLIAKGHISRPQAEVVAAEVQRLQQANAYSVVQQEASLGDLLLRTGKVTREQIYEALSIQSESTRKRMLVPLLGEILIEKGYVTRESLEETLRLQRKMVRLRCESCGTDYLLAELEMGRVYLCRKCAAPLAAGVAPPVARQPEPEEVERAATNQKNVVGRYVAVKELGRGGMGAVYKAWDTKVKRWVALKIHTVAGGVDGLIRFRREAETAASLQHPNIVPIFDVGESGDRHYIAMKYIEGQPLGMKLPVSKACKLMAQVAHAIAQAHVQGIVHRDLKPQNILVDGSGQPFIMDFGLAKNLLESFNITAPGTIMGSPSYMSPEQAAGQISKVDQRSDVYSLGAVLYSLLAGQPPFKGETPVLTIKAVIDQPVPPPSRINPEIPRALEQIVLRALSKEKAHRYATAGEFARELESFMEGKPLSATSIPVVAPPPKPPSDDPSRRDVLWVTIAVALLAGAALVLWKLFG